MKEMFRIKEFDSFCWVVCDCYKQNLKINSKCTMCGGKGVHKKSIKIWKICDRPESIIKIDRAEKDSYYGTGLTNETGYKEIATKQGELRYWTSDCEYFSENNKFIHFNRKDAQDECDFRNKVNKEVIKDCKEVLDRFIEIQQNLLNIKTVLVLQELGII